MISPVKTYPVLSREPVMRLGHSTATVLVSVILLGGATVPQSDSVSRAMSANELARRVVSNELKSQDEDQVHWMYRCERQSSFLQNHHRFRRPNTAATSTGYLMTLHLLRLQPCSTKR
jgi:hypothetical protein